MGETTIRSLLLDSILTITTSQFWGWKKIMCALSSSFHSGFIEHLQCTRCATVGSGNAKLDTDAAFLVFAEKKRDAKGSQRLHCYTYFKRALCIGSCLNTKEHPKSYCVVISLGFPKEVSIRFWGIRRAERRMCKGRKHTCKRREAWNGMRHRKNHKKWHR